jgi:hypothetical protein
VIRIVIIAVVLTQSAVTLASAQTLTCSTWQNIKTCTDGRGYVSHETERVECCPPNTATDGWDSNGDSWTISQTRAK